MLVSVEDGKKSKPNVSPDKAAALCAKGAIWYIKLALTEGGQALER
jgi:hypothetical protein